MKINFSMLQRNFELYQTEYEEAALRVLRSGWYVIGNELTKFEDEFASFIGMKYGIGVNSGQDALILAIRALGIGVGDEVITQANTYIASVLGITENGATPVFVEPDEYFGMNVEAIEKAITPRTKAILPVHLYGQPCNMSRIKEIADKYNLYIIEDCAQCHGAFVKERKAGVFSTISCFSFYPTKPLGAFGDAGICLTNDDEMKEKLRMLRFYGSRKKYVNEILGINSRMDEVQAAILSVGLKHLEEGNTYRQRIADKYLNEIHNSLIELPKTREGCTHVYHIFAILCSERKRFIQYMEDNHIQTQIHYPIPPHLATCYKFLGHKEGEYPIAECYAREEVSLPIYAGMPMDEVDQVISVINNFV